MKTCEYCIYFDPTQQGAADGICRCNSPVPGLAGSPAVVWPAVDKDDWCADGFNHDDGFYNPSPRAYK